jgi:hypothetical protein
MGYYLCPQFVFGQQFMHACYTRVTFNENSDLNAYLQHELGAISWLL